MFARKFAWALGVIAFFTTYPFGVIPAIFSGYFRKRLVSRIKTFGYIIRRADKSRGKRTPYCSEEKEDLLEQLWILVFNGFKEVAAAFVAGIVVVLLAFFVFAVVQPTFNLGDTTSPQPVQTLPTPETTLRSTEREQFMKDYGPWLSTEDALALRKTFGVRNLALVNTNGGVVYSENTFAFLGEEPWKPMRPPEVVSLRIDETRVTFATNAGREITLNVSQPFVFEGRVEIVYLIDEQGELYGAKLDQLMPYRAAQSHDPAIAPNPDLSVGR